MFEYLKSYRKIIVSGPQRSGTTFAAQVIAHELNLPYIDESRVGVDDLRAAFELVDSKMSFVLQAPGLLAYLWMLCPKRRLGKRPPERDDTAVVIMKRPIKEIVESQQRIGWARRFEPYELMKLGRLRGVISQEKYKAWEAQKPHIKRWYEVDYSSLKEHPLWVNKEFRERFKPKQTH